MTGKKVKGKVLGKTSEGRSNKFRHVDKAGSSNRKKRTEAEGERSGSRRKRRKKSKAGANSGFRKRIRKKFEGGESSDEGDGEETSEALGLEAMGGEGAIIDCAYPDTGYISEYYRDIDENEIEGANGHGGIEVENCGDLSIFFGEEARNDDPDVYADSGDDGWDDDKIPDPVSSDEEDEAESRPGKTYREDMNPEELLGLGKTFSSAEEFKHALLRYSLKTRYNIKLYRSSALKLGAKCAAERDDPCPWSVYCSYEKRKQKLMIKGYVNNHVCEPTGYSKMLKPSTIATLYAERLRLNPKITRYEMQAEIQREYGMIVTHWACGKAKTRVMNARKASHEEHFDRVWDYQAEILRSNLGSTMEIETIPGPTIGSKQRFYRMYVCFHSQKQSWKNTCRPIVGVDGAFLKWDIKGQLLAAVGRDGDNRIVPIAWAVVEVENETNWEWFLKHLAADLDLEDGKGYAILSDKQKGLVNVIHGILPAAEHRQCCRHIYDNWKKGSHDLKLQRLFWKIARSYTAGELRQNMIELEKYNAGAHATLLLTKPETWCRCYFKLGFFSNDITNNLCESFNRTIKGARRKPLLDMLEDIRRQCMVRNSKRSKLAASLRTTFTKKTHANIKKIEVKSKECSIYYAVGSETEVDHKGVGYTVDIEKRTCGCIRWQMTGIPCIHAAIVITHSHEKVEDYVVPCYSTVRWRETYNIGIRPVQGKILWPVTNRLGVLPPPWRTGNPGRPKNHDRIKSMNEKAEAANNTKLTRHKRIITCSNCKQDGHNKSTCENFNVPDQPKKPRGRPRKHQEGISSQTKTSQTPLSQPQSSQTQSFQAESSFRWEEAACQQASRTQGWGHWFGC